MRRSADDWDHIVPKNVVDNKTPESLMLFIADAKHDVLQLFESDLRSARQLQAAYEALTLIANSSSDLSTTESLVDVAQNALDNFGD